MSMLQVLFLGAILSIITGEILRFDIGDNIALRITDVLLTFCSLFYIVIILKQKKFPTSNLRTPILIFILICFLSLIFNTLSLSFEQLIIASLYLFRWIVYATAFFIILSFETKSIQKIKNYIYPAGFMVLLLGYIQFFFYPDLRNLFYQGWDEHNYRMFSVFLDPNFTGAFFVLFFIYSAGLIENKLRSGKIKDMVPYGLGMVLNIIALFLTYSRSALLMFIVSSITFLFLINKKKFLLIFIGIISVIFIILIPTFNKENTNPFRIASSFARIDSYENAMYIIKENPVIGIGFNSYRYAQQLYGFKSEQTEFPNHADAGVDSSLLFVFATTGIIGLISYLFIWYVILKDAFIKSVKSKNTQSIVVISSCFGLFVNSLFINSLFYPIIMLWMWIMVGLMKRE